MSQRNTPGKPGEGIPSNKPRNFSPGSQPTREIKPASNTKEKIAQLGSYGVKRSVGASSTARPRKQHIWRWVAGGLVVALLSFGLYTYIRVSSFVDNSFGGRNEGSLLTVSPPAKAQTTLAARPTTQALPTVSAPPFAPTATPRPARPDPAAIATAPVALPTPSQTEANLPAIIQKIKRGEAFTALVMGYGGEHHDGGYLTDTILQVTFDPVKNAVTMVNLPRDLFVFIPYGGAKVGFWGKINSAFSYVMSQSSSTNLSSRYRFQADDPKSKTDAAANLLKDVVEGITNTPIDYWAVFSFDGFRKFVDAIGGVDVNVETTFDDYEYPANDDPSIDASYMHIHFNAGPQHMNGEKAIQYARSRKSVQDGNDFGRSKRQMRLIGSVKEQIARPDVMFKAFGMMDALQGNLRTSLSLDEARALMDYYRGGEGAASIKNLLFVPQVLSTNNFLSDGSSNDGAYILFPQAGQSNYKAIQEWLARGREFPQLRVEGLKVQVQNGSDQQTLLNRLTKELDQNGLDLLSPVWANSTASTTIFDYSNGKALNTLKTLTNSLPNATVQTLKKPTTSGPDVVVLLGSDYGSPANAGSREGGKSGATENFPSPYALNLPASTTPNPVYRPQN